MHNHLSKILLCFIFLLNSACVPFVQYKGGSHNNVRATKSVSITNKVVNHHRVKAGETLYSIAFQYGHDPRDVARWNKVRRPYTIYPKQKLRVVPIKSDNSAEKEVVKVESRITTGRKITPIPDNTRFVSNAKLKWQWPTKGKVVSTFSIRDPGRRGIDIVGRKGQSINAAAEGRVVYRGNGLRGYGNLIIIKHNETYFSAYAHTQNVVVKEKEKVKLGQHIADMGSTSSEKTKLHFEIRRNGKPVNPLRSLPKRR